MKFREHRGLLADSMETCVELADRAALEAHLEKLLGDYPYKPHMSQLRVEPYFMMRDERIGWPMTYIVHFNGFGVMGFTDGPVNE